MRDLLHNRPIDFVLAPCLALVLVCAWVLNVSAQPGDAAGTSAFDPDRGHGGFDIWMAPLQADGTFGAPVNLGPNINTTRRETTPLVSWDGNELYFASSRRADGLGREDLYVSRRGESGWEPAENLGDAVNSSAVEIGPCLLPDSGTLLYSRRDDAQEAYDLLLTVNIEETWLTPLLVSEPLNTPGDERLCSITADGRAIYYAALRPSGEGSFDLYVAYRDDADSGWQDPINLGPQINSSESDYSPGVSPDGQRLYFSSQREEVGNFDLYVTAQTDGRWSAPVRLPSPVNSRHTEYCPTVGPDGNLYFASDRRRGTPDESKAFEE